MMSLSGILDGILTAMTTLPLIEITETGIEGATTGLISSYDVLIRSAIETFSDVLSKSSAALCARLLARDADAGRESHPVAGDGVRFGQQRDSSRGAVADLVFIAGAEAGRPADAHLRWLPPLCRHHHRSALRAARHLRRHRQHPRLAAEVLTMDVDGAGVLI
ncbi:hypothetical protein PINS_up022928 [Pythium insidiosum]|nr:hypothetical protein PINS_up022928 [Pythium insidiosum]